MRRASRSFASIFGVVPEAMNEWNPENAPQAIVMNAKGNSLPASTGPSHRVENGVRAGILSGGRRRRMGTARNKTVDNLRNVDRQSRGVSYTEPGRTDG